MSLLKRLRRPLLIGGLAILGLFVALVIFAVIDPKAFPPTWDHQAVGSTASAARIVGAEFSEDDRRLYSAGLRHVSNAHRDLSSLTIGEVVDQERDREASRAAARAAIAERAAQRARARAAAVAAASERARARASTQAAANVVAGERTDIKASFEFLASNWGGDPFPVRGSRIDGETLWIRVDDDIFGAMSDQDRTMLRNTFEKTWAAIYNQRHGTRGEDTQVEILDLNDKVI